MKPKRRLLLAHAVLVLLFLYLPIAVIILFSFNDSRLNASWQGWTWKWYASLFDNIYLLEALGNSLIIALCSTVMATALGTMSALAVPRLRPAWRARAQGLLYLPVLVPDIVLGISLMVLFSQWFIPLGKLTILIAHVTFSISYVHLIVSARLEGLNKFMGEAAQDLGATPWQTFRHVTLPLIAPGVIAAALICFTLSIDDFLISFFVAGTDSTTLPIYIYGLVKRGISPEINALSTLLILFTISMLVLAEWFRSRSTHPASDSKSGGGTPGYF